MTAQDIVKHLLEAEPYDSMEGTPDFDEFMAQHFSANPLKPSREWKLRYEKPHNPREARALGVNWYIKDGRRYTFSMAEPDYGGYPRKSHTLATNRNQRRKSFGYRDTYSVRERDWPSGGNAAYYKRQDRARQEREARLNAEIEAMLGGGI